MRKLSSKSVFLITADIVLLSGSFLLSSYLVSFRWGPLSEDILGLLALLLMGQILIFLKLGLYHASLRYAGVDFLVSIFKGATLSALLLAFGLYVARFHSLNRFLFVEWLLTLAFVGGSRFLVRYFWERQNTLRLGKRVLIYGAGDMGFLALRQLKMDKTNFYSPVAFIDDDPAKKGRHIQSVPVLCDTESLEKTIDTFNIEEVIVAIADISGDKLRDIVKRCRNRNVICRIIPHFSKMLHMEPQLRSVELSDLIRRSPKDLDMTAIGNYLCEKVVLVTGAAGSIGSELVCQALQFGPKKIIALDQSEYGLYELQEKLGNEKVVYTLCDVCNNVALEEVFDTHRPDIVFHAAAYKHVPMLEANSFEAIRNNVGSTRLLAKLANQYKTDSFVLISTDKAVKPSSIMGASKRICEILIQNYNRFSSTSFVAVRFGNVLGSSGSVIPKFIRQIKSGGPVTITHPDTTRYFMLINEAIQLVLQSAAIGTGGEIFILDMGKPVKITEMAEDLIYLLGYKPHVNIQIAYTGLRIGEKIFEELFNDEIEEKTQFKDITVGKSMLVDWHWFEKSIERLLDCCSSKDSGGMAGLLGELTAEANFKSLNSKSGHLALVENH